MIWKKRYHGPKTGDKVKLINRENALCGSIKYSKITFIPTIDLNKGQILTIKSVTSEGYYVFGRTTCHYNPKCFEKVLE